MRARIVLANWRTRSREGRSPLATIWVYWPVEFQYSFNGYELVQTYVDAKHPRTEDFMMRELAVHGTDDYNDNQRVLNRLWSVRSAAFLGFGVEIVALVLNTGPRRLLPHRHATVSRHVASVGHVLEPGTTP
jgi:hypothetical protein